MKNFINYAHRGASSYAPENTMSSFRLGIEMGANGIETDVQLTSDGIAVLFHDDTVTRMTGREGKVSDYTLAELLSFDITNYGKSDKIMTLDDFLKEFGSLDLTFAIELKGKNTAKITYEHIKRYGVEDKCIITSFMYEELLDYIAISGSNEVGYLALIKEESEIKPLLDKMRDDGIVEFCPEAKFINSKSVKEWHDLGFRVRAWGVYDEQLMQKVYLSGADGMTVNFPDKLTEFINKD